MLRKLGRGWREAIASVIIDRAIGIASLFAIGFVVVLFPSALTELGGRRLVFVLFFGLTLAAGGTALLMAPRLALLMGRGSYTAEFGRLVNAAHTLLLRRREGAGIMAIALAVHAFTVFAVWSLARAAGFPVSILEAAILFVVVVAVALVPISIGGWGVRELAVTSLLSSYGVPLERALLFSLGFGLALLVAALPGALIWAVYSPSAGASFCSRAGGPERDRPTDFGSIA
jgi:uncharacterized membrane protein YbhN (UPF0104 family)